MTSEKFAILKNFHFKTKRYIFIIGIILANFGASLKKHRIQKYIYIFVLAFEFNTETLPP